MYVHGFGSSGQSGTVTRIREVLTEAEVIAPDLPIHPEEAMTLLYNMCETEKPDLIIGTSMAVYPAAGLIHYARRGVPIYYIDPRPVPVPDGITVLPVKATEGMRQLIEILRPKP